MSEEDRNQHRQQQQHAAQRERRSEWLEKLRVRKKFFESQGIQGWDLLEAMTTLSLEHKIALSRNRCPQCWHDQPNNNCICSQLAPVEELEFKRDQLTFQGVKLLILMHHKEYLGAGNSAKLLLQLLPDQTVLYIFGKRGDLDRLIEEIALDRRHTMILWPGQTALSIPEFLDQMRQKDFLDVQTNANASKTVCTDSHLLRQKKPFLRAIFLDGTYTQARSMHKSLRKRLGNNLPLAVALRPTSDSIFHRAQKNYGKAHQRQQLREQQHEELVVQRISTAEACGQLLTELGADESIQDCIVQAVLINNDALAYARGKSRTA